MIVLGLMVANIGCSKDDNDNSGPKTKTELLTTGTWKFSDAKVGGQSVASFIETCQKDNILTFLAAGTGTADEGATNVIRAIRIVLRLTGHFKRTKPYCLFPLHFLQAEAVRLLL
jgi:hypothetical protein